MFVWVHMKTLNPTSPNECSISDGVDTKIVTYHFTEFTGLSTTVTTTTTTPSTSTATTSNSNGGSGRTGVGPSSAPSSGSSRGGNSIITFYPVTTVNVIPSWLENAVQWWNEDKITDNDFKNIITYVLDKDIIPTETPKQPKPLIDLAPSMRHLFSMWVDDKLPESSIIGLIHYYREMGVW